MDALSTRERWSHSPNAGKTVSFDRRVSALDVGTLDGNAVAVVGHDGGPSLIDLDTGRRRAGSVPCTATAVRCFEAESTGSSALLGGADGTVRWLDLRHAHVGDPLELHEGPVTEIVTTGESGASFATASLDGSIVAWSFTDGTMHRRHGAHERGISALAGGEIPDGERVLVSGGEDGLVRFWNPSDPGGLVERRAAAHDELAAIRALVVLTQEGRSTLVAGGLNGSIVLRDLETGDLVSGPHHIDDGGISTLALVELDGRRVLLCGLASTTWRGPRAWDLDAGRLLPGVLPRPVGRDDALAVTAIGGHAVTVLAHGTGSGLVTTLPAALHHFDAASPGHTSGVRGMDVAQVAGRDLVLTTGRDQTVRLTALEDGRELDRFDSIGIDLDCVAWSGPDDDPRALVTQAGGAITVYRPASGWALTNTIHTAGKRLTKLGVVRSGGRELAVAASPMGGLYGFDITDPTRPTAQSYSTFGEDWLMGLSVAPSGVVAASRGQDVRLFRATDGHLVHTWRELGRVFALAQLVAERRHFHERRELVAVGGDERIVRLRDLAGTEVLAPLVGHTDIITALADVPGTSLLLSASEDGSVRLWDVIHSHEIASATVQWRPERLVPRLRDGRLLVVVAGGYLATLEFDLPRT